MPDYEIEVAVTPDGSRFPEQLASVVGKAEARQDPLEVELSPKVDRTFVRDARRELKTALAQLDAQVSLSPELAKSFRRDVQKLAREATRGNAVEVPIAPTLGKGFRRDLQRAMKEATAGTGAPEVAVQAKLGPGFRGKLQRAITEATKAKPLTAQVALEVSKRAYPDFVKDVISNTSAAIHTATITGATAVPLSVDSGKFGAELVAQVTAATRAVSASDAADVTIGVDTGPAAAEIAAVGTAATGSSAAMSTFVTGSVIGLASIVTAAGLAGVALFKVGETFDEAFDTIQVTTGATGPLLQQLQDDFRNVAAVAPSSFEDVATAVAGVNQRLGLTGPIGEEVATQLLNLSRITGTDLNANLVGAAGALQSFQIPAEQMPAALDAIFRASQASGVGVDALTTSLQTSGAALRTAGFDFEESTALLAQLERAGVPAEQVIGSLSIAARKLAKDGKDPAVAIGELVGQIQAAKSPTEALAIAQEVFGRGAVGVTDAIRSGKFELGDFLETVKGGAGTIAQTSADTADAAESFQLLKNNLALALEEPASAFFGQIGDTLKALTPALSALGGPLAILVTGLGSVASGFLKALVPVLEQALPALAPIAVLLGDAFGKLGPVLAPVIGALGEVLSAVAPLLPVFGQLIGVVAKTLVPVIAGLADALAPVIELLADQLGDVLTALAPIFVELGRAVGGLLADIGPVLVEVLQGALQEIAPLLPDLAEAAVEMASAFAELLVALLPLLPPLIKLAVRFFTKPNLILITLLARAVGALASALAPLAAAAAELLASGLDKVLELTSGLGDLDADKVQEGLGNIGSAIVDGLGAGLTAIGNFLTEIPGKLAQLPGLIVSALASLGSTVGGLFLDALAAAAGAVANGILEILASIIALPFQILSALLSLPQLLVDAFGLAFRFLTQTLPRLAAGLFQFWASLPGRIIGFVTSLPGRVASVFSSIFNTVGPIVSRGIERVVGFFSGLPGRILGLAGRLLSAGKELGGSIIRGISNGLKNALGVAGDIAGGVAKALKGAINSLIDKLNDKIPNKLGKGILSIDIPDNPIPHLARGALITTPTLALVGEAGPELVLPLNDKARLVELLTQAGVLTGAGGLAGAIPGAAAADAAASAGATDPAAMGAGLGWQATTEGLKAWVDESVALLTGLGERIADGSLPPLASWAAAVSLVFAGLALGIQLWSDQTTATLFAWASTRVPAATLPALGSWRLGVAAVATAAGQDVASGLASGLAAAQTAASVGGTRIVAAMVSALSGGTAKVTTVATGYARKLADGLNPILRAVGKPDLKLARGGYVPGPDVNRDVVPAMLMPGEVVIRKASVQQFGAGNLLALNAGKVPPGWSTPRGYAEGGTVTGDTQGLNPEFHRRLGLWSAAVGSAYHVGSGYRSLAEQTRLYQRYLAGVPGQAPAAPPGRSMHNFGLASDGNRWRDRNPGLFGLRFPMSYEPWHVEPVEARAWARGGFPDGAAGGAAGLFPGLTPLEKPPAMPFDGAVATVGSAVLQHVYDAALAWGGGVSFDQPLDLKPQQAPEGFATGGLVGSDGLHRQAALLGTGGLMSLTRPNPARELEREAAIERLLSGQGGGGRDWPTIEGDLIVKVTPPDASDPENYGMALSHRLIPAIAAALARL